MHAETPVTKLMHMDLPGVPDSQPLPQILILDQSALLAETADAGVLLLDVSEGHATVESTLEPLQALYWLHTLHSVLDDLCSTHGVVKFQSFGPTYGVCARPDKADARPTALRLLQFAHAAFYAVQKCKLSSGGSVRVRAAMHTGLLLGGVLGVICLRYGVYGSVLLVAQKLLEGCPIDTLQMTAEAYETLQQPYPCQRAVCMDGVRQWETCVVQLGKWRGPGGPAARDSFQAGRSSALQSTFADATACRVENKGSAENSVVGLQGWWNRSSGCITATCSEEFGAPWWGPAGDQCNADNATQDGMYHTMLALLDASQLWAAAITSTASPFRLALLVLLCWHIVLAVLAVTTHPSPHQNRQRLLLLFASILPFVAANAHFVANHLGGVPGSQRMSLLTVVQAVVINTLPVCLGLQLSLPWAAVLVVQVLAASSSSIATILVKQAQLEVPWQLLQALAPHLLMTTVVPMLFWYGLQHKHVLLKGTKQE